jgi:HSP20 family protein
MNVVKFNPFFPARGLGNIIDDVFNRSISELVGSDFALNVPSVNISETAESFILEFAAPGLDKKDFNISIENNQLTVSAEKRAEKDEKEEGKWTRREFNYSGFRRSFTLTDDVMADKIEAAYDKGILMLTLPKKEEARVKPALSIEIK